jgi:hypothetical protein
MIVERFCSSLFNVLPSTIMSIAAATAILSFAGCLAPAALAPLALQAGEAAVGAIGATGSMAQGRPAGDPSESEERCDELQLEVPGAIEFKVAADSPTAWRELQLGGSTDSPQWQAIASDESDAAGWRPLVNLSTMRFAPPLQNELRAGKPNYLAYAPAEPRTSVERDQLVALTADFGAGIGTFEWKGRAYQYTLVNRLPCFPGPIVVAGRSHG